MNRKAMTIFWLIVVMTGVGVLLTLSPRAQELQAQVESPSAAEAVSIPQTALRATTAVSPAYETQSWENLGGPPGGKGYDIRINPDSPNIMYVTSSPNGIAKSTDNGETWAYINQGIKPWGAADLLWVFCATIDPHDSDTVWIGTQFDAHIYRSTNGDQPWLHRDTGIVSKTGEHSLRGITVDPVVSSTIYAALEDFPDGMGVGPVWGEVYKSTDRGQNWTIIWYGDNLARYIWVDPSNNQRIYVSTGIFDRNAANGPPDGAGGGVGILRSDNGGTNWDVLSTTHGLGGLYVPSLFMHPVTPTTLLAAVTGYAGDPAQDPGAYVTYDGGDNWVEILEYGVEAVEISEKNPNVWYAATSGTFYRSYDAGQTWQSFLLRAGGRESGIPIDIQVDPRNEYRVFVNSYGGGNFVSHDGGKTWDDASQGYTGADITGVAVSPETGARVFAAGETTAFRSTNGGRAWVGNVREKLGEIVIAPQAGGPGTHIMSGDSKGNIYHSIDGGDTWTTTQAVDIPTLIADEVISDTAYIAWAFDVAPSDPQTVYLGYSLDQCWLWDWTSCALHGRSPGFFRSRDGGYHWDQITNTLFADDSILSLAVSHQISSTLYVATMSGVYRSQDSGDNWQHLSALETVAPPPTGQPVASVVATDPFSPSDIYVGTPHKAVYLSQDGGASWGPLAAGLNAAEPIRDLLPDPNRQGVFYAASKGSGVFYWTNENQMWRQAGDSTKMIARKLALSEDGSLLYVGTYGMGVFRLGTLYISNTPPVAEFNVSPSTGETGTVFSFDAADCADAEDPTSSLRVRWDWDDDGLYDTGWRKDKGITHTFDVTGLHTIRVEVRDTGGLKDNVPRQVMVLEASSNTPPAATFNVSPGSGDTSTGFSFDGSGSSDAEDAAPALSVRWDWEDDGVYDTGWSTTKAATHTYAVTGTYTVRMEARDTGGLTSDTTRYVTVTEAVANTPPMAEFNVSPGTGETDTVFSFDASGCVDAQDATAALEVRWDWEDDGVYDTGWSTDKGITHTYAVAGMHTIRVEVRDSGGLTGNVPRQVMVLEANPNTPPTAAFDVSPTGGDTSTGFFFDGSGSSDAEDPPSALEVRWDWDDDGIYDTGWSTVQTATHSFAVSGTHTVRMEARDTGSLTGDATRQVTVTEAVANTPPVAEFNVSPGTGETGTVFSFDASGCIDAQDAMPVLEVRWDWEDDGIYDTGWSADKGVTHTFAVTGVHTVRVEVRDTGGLTDNVPRQLMVLEASANTPPTATFSVNPGSGDVSTGFSFDGSGSSDAEDPPSALKVRWDWEDDGVYDTGWSTVQTATHSFAVSGTHTVRIEARDTGGLTGDATRQVTVTGTSANTPPLAVFNTSPSAGETNTVFSFDGSGSNDAEDPAWMLEMRWDWDDDGVYDTGWSADEGITHTYAVSGMYTIRMEVRDSGGLTDNAPRQVMVLEAGPNTPPTATMGTTAALAAFDARSGSGDTNTEFFFDGSGSSDAEDPTLTLELRWDWEDDGVYDTGWSTVKTATHTFAVSDTYTVRMEARDTGGLTGDTTQQVTVEEAAANTPPVAAFNVSPSAGETGDVFSFDASDCVDAQDATPVLEVRWDWEDDGVYDTAWNATKAATHTYAVTGIHTIRVEVRDTGGLIDNAPRQVMVLEAGSNTPPAATFDVSPGSGDTATEFFFDGGGSSDAEDPTSTLEVRWDWEDDGVYDTGWNADKGITHVFAAAVTHTVRMEVRDTGGLTDDSTRQVTVQEPVLNTPPVAEFNVSPGTGDTSTIFFFDGSGSSDAQDAAGTLELRWDWEDDGTYDTGWNTDKTPTHTYAVMGIHTIRMEVRDTDGLIDNVPRQVMVLEASANTPPTAVFDASPSVGDTNTVFSFDGSDSSDEQDAMATLKVRWDWEDDGIYDTGWSTDKMVAHTYAVTGVHTIRMEVRDSGGLADNVPRQVMVLEASSNTPPMADFDVIPDGGDTNTVFLFDGSNSNDAQDETPVLQVRWDWEDDGVYDTGWSTGKTITRVFATSTTHTVRLEVWDTGGLTHDTTRQMIVSDASPNTPPVADFDVIPLSGDTNTVFLFDGSVSSDTEDPLEVLKVRWDWEDDGTYDADWRADKTITHTYAVTGTYTVRMEVRDGGDLADSTTRQVMVIEASSDTLIFLPLVLKGS